MVVDLKINMGITLAHLGPKGTNTETAAQQYAQYLTTAKGELATLYPCPSIAQSLHSVAEKQATLAVVPVENSTEGTVTVTLDTLWQLPELHIQTEIILPIYHALLSCGVSLEGIKTVYSHPQALSQCQLWLETHLPQAQIIPSNSTTEALQHLNLEPTSAAIAPPRAALLYDLPILIEDINDYPDNCTRFWILGSNPSTRGDRISLGFSVPANVPGALVQPLQIFAERGINLSKIESRPTKRTLGEYVFFLDIESNGDRTQIQEALEALSQYTKVVRVFGHYDILGFNLPLR
jgi:prephenate dehydratase